MSTTTMPPAGERPRTAWHDCASIIQGAILTFCALNLVLYAYFAAKEAMAGTSLASNPVARAHGVTTLRNAYPGMSDDDINALLTEIWTMPLSYEPFVQFKEAPRSGTFVNVAREGFRRTRNQGPWPPAAEAFTVFLFGGSTTFGYGVSDGDTIASYLQEALSQDSSARVYNFGRAYYYSSQERLLFEKLLSEGPRPDVAVFIDGLNEFWYELYPDRPMYSDQLAAFMDRGHTAAYRWQSAVETLPMARAFRAVRTTLWGAGASESISAAAALLDDPKYYEDVIRMYRRNKRAIEAVGDVHGVKTVFVWQPVPSYKYDLRYHPFQTREFKLYELNRVGYGLLAESRARESLGPNFVWAADMQEHARASLYVDEVHYSPSMSRQLADLIAREMRTRHLVPDAPAH